MASQYWKLIETSDTEELAKLLAEQPELVHETFPGDARTLALETTSPFTNTALHYAVVHDRIELAGKLLEAGADPNAIGYQSQRGLTPPLVLATAEASSTMMELLLEKGANPNLEASAESALYCAIENGSGDKVDLLLSKGARHDVFTAAMAGEVDLVVHHLRAYPTLLKARSRKRQRTPWDEAATHEQDDVMAAIRKWTEEGKADQTEPEDHWGSEATQWETAEMPASSSEADDWSDWVGDSSSWPG